MLFATCVMRSGLDHTFDKFETVPFVAFSSVKTCLGILALCVRVCAVHKGVCARAVMKVVAFRTADGPISL